MIFSVLSDIKWLLSLTMPECLGPSSVRTFEEPTRQYGRGSSEGLSYTGI